MSLLANFTTPTPRAMPVILLLDSSGSMNADGKIGALNRAVQQMLHVLARDDASSVEIQVAIITFGGDGARIHLDLQPVSSVTSHWTDIFASGKTPMGAAYKVAAEMINDRQKIPPRAYAPTVVLVSDGNPTDDWQTELERFLNTDRAAKAARFAMAIGEDADLKMLSQFIKAHEERVFLAHEAAQIAQFFEQVTMSISFRSHSANPNAIPATEVDD